MKQIKMQIISRRNILLLLGGATGSLLFSNYALAKPNLALNKIKEISKNTKVEETDLFLDVPEIAENGNQVKVSFEMDSPMTQSDYIKSVYILSDGNPSPNVAKFSFTPKMGSCSATTRMRLSKTQNVYLLAESNSGQFLMTNAKVKVTIGGCGG